MKVVRHGKDQTSCISIRLMYKNSLDNSLDPDRIIGPRFASASSGSSPDR